MAVSLKRELSSIVGAWVRKRICGSFGVFAEKLCVYMRLGSNSITCCGSCIRATLCTLLLAQKETWLSVLPASSLKTARPVRGVLELLTAAYSMIPALAEARILEFNTQVRPALPDNLPVLRFDREQKVLHINGLYRHGFLLTPTVVEEVLGLFSGRSSGRWPCLDVNCSADVLRSVNHSRERQACLSS